MDVQSPKPRSVKIIGHKNPDTDSVCSAIAYSRLKSRIDPDRLYVPCRAGMLNRETQFVLDYFHQPTPKLYTDVSPQIRDVDFRRMEGVDGEMSLRRAWITMRDRSVDTLCIIDEEKKLLGVVTIRDLATANMDNIDEDILAKARVSYQNIIDTLDATVEAGEVAGRTVTGRIIVGAGSAEMMERSIAKGDIVIVSNRADSQLAAIEMDAGCIVVCGSQVSRTICMLAEEKGCIIITTPLSTYVAGQMITQAVPLRYYMKTKDLLTFTPHTSVESATKVMAAVRIRYFPILDDEGVYLGIVSRRNMLGFRKKQLILVDHNEKAQAVDGLEEADVLEIIDHHRIGSLETDGPVYFRNVPVGCTSTIVYQMYGENGLQPDKDTAGLMLSAILSDTLMFRSPTCTPADENAARALAQLAGVDLAQYADAMFEAGGDVTGKTAEEILNTDYKIFTYGDLRFGVGQGIYLSERNRSAAEALVGPYLPTTLERQGVDMVFYMLTDIRDSNTDLMMAGRDATDVVRRGFEVEPENGLARLPGVVSRKKQLVPALLNAIKQRERE